jgi:hypothetical protein
MSIPHQTWSVCREDYIRGRGSIAVLARSHGLKKSTVEKCAKREEWKRLRDEFETRQRDKLLPPIPAPPPVPAIPPAPKDEIEGQLQRLVTHRDRIDEMIAGETDPAKLDRLSSARARLFEQWRILANLPLPGSRRPPKERRRFDFVQEPIPMPVPIAPNTADGASPVMP